MDEQIFLVGQKAFIEKDGQVLVLFDEIGLDIPGGKIQEGETDLEESLRREIREETSLEIEIGDPFTRWVFNTRNQKHLGKKVFAVGYKCKYKSGEIKLSDEHTSFKWVDKSNYQSVDDGSEFFKALAKYFND